MSAPAVLADGRHLSGEMLRRLFIGQCLVLALHLAWLPWWLVSVAGAVAGYRYLQLRRQWPAAGKLMRVLAVVVIVAVLWLQYGGLRDMDALLGLLLGIYLLKLMETRSRRDGRVVVAIGLVALTGAFLHDQGILIALGALAALTWLTQSLVWLSGAPDSRRAWRETVWLLGLSAPLMVLLFVIVPRLGPLWSLPPSQQASTGLTDRIAPGDIAELSRSAKRAFRASVEGGFPPPAQRYWRVYTLSHFDGVSWSRPESTRQGRGQQSSSRVQLANRSPWAAPDEQAYRIELLLEPDSRAWRPSLGTPLATDSVQHYLSDGTLEGPRGQNARSLVQLTASGQPPDFADAAGHGQLTELPVEGNARTRQLADTLWRSSGRDPAAYIEAILARFSGAPYRYTLSPPALSGTSRADDFLFDSAAGYCSHYASATALMARMVGIPSRVVAGFVGGELHPDGYITVRDYDAHAWVEVWIDGRWRRVDPTAAIAPERIEQGAAAVEGAESTFLANSPFSLLRVRDVGWINRLRLGWERTEYAWQRRVVGYQGESAGSLWSSLVANLSRLADWLMAPKTLAGLAKALTGVGVAWFALLLWRRRTGKQAHEPLEQRRMRKLQVWLARQGWPAAPGETPAAHLRRLAERGEGGPAVQALRACADDFERLSYAPLGEAERQQRRRLLLAGIKDVRSQCGRAGLGVTQTGAGGSGVSS